MIDHHNENLLPLTRVPRILPKQPGGTSVHVATIYRWISRGIRGTRLETIRIGGRRYTSVEAVDRFIRATSEQSCSVGSNECISQTAKHNRRRHRPAVKRALEEILEGPSWSGKRGQD